MSEEIGEPLRAAPPARRGASLCHAIRQFVRRPTPCVFVTRKLDLPRCFIDPRPVRARPARGRGRNRRPLHPRRPPRTGRASEAARAAEGGSMTTNGLSEQQPERPRPRPCGPPTRLTPLLADALVAGVRPTGFITPR